LSRVKKIEKKSQQGARQGAHHVLGRVYGQGAYADITLAKAMEKVRPEDRALCTELVYGVLRRSITIDWIIDGISSVKRAKMETAVLTALRLGVYQIFFLSRIPDSASVNESVKLVKGGRKKGFVNAVLRRAALEKENFTGPGEGVDELTRLSITGSHPKWMVKRWLARYGPAGTEALMQANLKAPRKTLRVNTLRISIENFLTRLKGLGVRARLCTYSPYGVDIESGSIPAELKEAGLCIEQDEASQAVAMLVAPRPGERILDACAAPGLKTTHMSQMMNNEGEIVAVDKYAGRLTALNEISNRLGASIIKSVCGDSEKKDFFSELSENPFDAVLVDAPCSGLGVLGRTPDIKLRRSLDDIKAIAKTQKNLLRNLIPFVKPGGRLIYSVCTLEPEETTGVVEFFLREHDDVYIEDGARVLPKECGALINKKGYLKTLPHLHHMDGFFAARFRRRG